MLLVQRRSRKRLGEMVGLRWALRRLGQQGALNSRRGLSKREGLELMGREYSSAGRGIGIWGACFDGGQPHEVLSFAKPQQRQKQMKSLSCQGTGEAPGLLREAGLLRRLREGGCSVTDHGDLVSLLSLAAGCVYNSLLQQVGSRGGQEEVLEFSKRTAAQVKAILDQGQVF